MSYPLLEAINSLRNLLHRESQQDNLLYGRGAKGRRAAPTGKRDVDAKIGCRLDWGEIFTTHNGSSQRVNLMLNRDAEDPDINRLANQNPDFVWSWAEIELKSERSRKDLWKDFDALFVQLKTNLETSVPNGSVSPDFDDPYAPRTAPLSKVKSGDRDQSKQGGNSSSGPTNPPETTKQPAPEVTEQPTSNATKQPSLENPSSVNTKPITVAGDVPEVDEISKPENKLNSPPETGKITNIKHDPGDASGLEDFHDAHEIMPPKLVPYTSAALKASEEDQTGSKDMPQAESTQHANEIGQPKSALPLNTEVHPEVASVGNASRAINVPSIENPQYVDASTQTEETSFDRRGLQLKDSAVDPSEGAPVANFATADDFPDLANGSDSDPFAPKESSRLMRPPNASKSGQSASKGLARRTRRTDTSDDDPFAPKSITRPNKPVPRSSRGPIAPASFQRRPNLEDSSDDDPFAPKGYRKSKSLRSRNTSGR